MVNVKKLKDRITSEEIKVIFSTLFGVEPMGENDDVIIYPTFCHNENVEQASSKLYYYKESKTFYCFTECHHSFDLIDLIISANKVRGIKKDFFEVIEDVISIVGFIDLDREEIAGTGYESVKNYYSRKQLSIPYTIYDKNILNFFPFFPHPSWLNEGISEEVMKKYEVRFYISGNQIIIPHFDDKGQLIGIRARFLNPEDYAKGKYRPVTLEGRTYKHPVSQFCYGLWNSKEAIATHKKAIIFEGEKSVLKAEKLPANYSVACCGSNISKTQILQLISYGAKEITIAFDKEYANLREEQSTKYFDKLYSLADKYSLYCNMSFIFDFDNLLSEKDSPIDKGVETFDYLYRKRVHIK